MNMLGLYLHSSVENIPHQRVPKGERKRKKIGEKLVMKWDKMWLSDSKQQ